MRLPLAVNLESRDGTVDQDCKVLNGVVEVKGQETRARMRPGSVDLGLVKAGVAQLLYNWNGIKAILADVLNAFTLTGVITPVQTNLSPTSASQQFSAQDNGSNSTTPYLMIQNGLQAWSVNQAGAVAAITLPAALGLHVISITSLTRTGGVATALTATDPLFDVGQSITIAGATPGAYNGAQVVTSVTAAALAPAASIPITITRVGTTATATTVSGPHGLTTGTYTIAEAAEAAYNGAFAITVTTPTQFTYTVTLSGTGPDNDISITITRSGSTATATSISPHGLANGTYTIAGADQVEYNGPKAITVTGATTFTFAVTVADSPATPATGSPTFYFENIGSYSFNNTGPLGRTVIRVTKAGNTVFNGEVIFVTALASGGLTAVNATSVGFEINIPGYSAALGPSGFTVRRTPPSVSSITRSVGTATLTTSSAHRMVAPDFVTVSGATQPQYNLRTNVTVTGATTFTYPVTVTSGSPESPATGTIVLMGKAPATPATGAPVVTNPAVSTPASFTFTIGGGPATPATGTITGSYSKTLVPGVAYVDGYFNIMDETGVIYSSNSDDPTTWGALSYLTAQNENGGGVAINKSQSNVVALKEWSTEFFYDAKNANGSPFSPVDNGFTQIGCASGHSVATLDDALIWVSQTRAGGRGVHMMSGTQQQKISTPDVDRILAGDSLATVRAFTFKLYGHSLYLLTLVSSNITLVYDATSAIWSQWTSNSFLANISISSITRSGNTATATSATPHGLSDGDPALVFGASQPDYSGMFQIRYVSPTVFTFDVQHAPATPATGTIQMLTYAETYFKYTKHLNYNGLDLFLHESDGHLYLMDAAQFLEAALIPVNFFIRTQRLDGGSDDRKKIAKLRVVGDRLSAIAMVRFSDDDCLTFSEYRPVNLDDNPPQLRKCGAFRRRTIELRYISGRYLSDAAPNFSALELEIKQ